MRPEEDRRQVPVIQIVCRERLLARQVLIWGLTMDPIFADGAAKLRSRAAPSARIEPRVLFLTEN